MYYCKEKEERLESRRSYYPLGAHVKSLNPPNRQAPTPRGEIKIKYKKKRDRASKNSLKKEIKFEEEQRNREE